MAQNETTSACHALVLTAHCDDAELWAGGTLARWAESGLRCVVGIAFHNQIRRTEAQRSAVILGYEPRFMPPEGDLTSWILDLLMQCQPEVLLTHPENDPHFQHQCLHRCVVEALTRFPHRKASPKRWYAFDSYYQTRLPPGIWPMTVDIGETLDRKLSALAVHQSQDAGNLTHMARHTAAMAGMRTRMDFAEAFYPFDLLGRWAVLRDLP